MATAFDRRSVIKLGALAAMAAGMAPLAACAQPDSAASGKPEPSSYSLENIRDYIVGLNEEVQLEDGSKKPVICFDNAATTPALVPVLNEVERSLLTYGSIGRGFSPKSDLSSETYDTVRQKVLLFLNADPETYTCFYANTATDGLNKLATALIDSKDDIVLSTRMEHHANDLPWRSLCKVIYAEVDEQGRLKYEDIEQLLAQNKVKYVTVTAASNVTGYTNDVHRIAKMAHQHGAKIIVDGAQIVAHRAFSMKGDTPEEDIDFFAFSAHKMYSPFGGGAVVGPFETLNERMPQFYGGGIVRIVADDWAAYKDAPEKYEAGSPNFPGVVGMGKAIDVLQQVGFDAIQAHEQALNRKLLDGLAAIDGIVLYGDSENIEDRTGVITFNLEDVNSKVLATRLSSTYAVATRRGAFCAHPYVWRLMKVPESELQGFVECTDVNTPGMIRVSFGIYNTEEEVDTFLGLLPEAIEQARKDMEGYSRAEPSY